MPDSSHFVRMDELLLLALHAAQLGAWENDLDTGENYWHAGMAHLLGVPADQAAVESHRFAQYIYPEDRERVLAAFGEIRDAREPGAAWESDFRVVRADGSVRWFNSRGMVVELRNGKRRMVGVSQDITARKATEQRLAEQARLLDLSRDAIVVRTLDARILSWNTGAEDLYGFSREQAVGRTMHELLHTEFPEPLGDIHERLLETGRWSGELVHTRADGTRVVVATRWVLDRDGSGSAHRVLETNTDIGERKEAERRLRESEAALREADRRKNEFLATLAHELRNPLAPIRNATHLLSNPQPEEPRHRMALDILERQVRHMVRLVDDLLDVGRITSGKLRLVRERVELASAIEHAIEATRPFAGHQFSASLPPHPLYIEGDLVRLTQVFSNLLGNAVKYTPDGGAITLLAEECEGTVEVKISDQGIGAEPGELEQMFEMFAQVEAPDGTPHIGLGVGLALARAFVELHGGTIEAHSDGRDQGALFVVRLPLAKDAGA